jgi:hypothetical protein
MENTTMTGTFDSNDPLFQGSPLIEAIKAGQVACDAFSDAVKAAGYKSRWDRLDYEKHPALKAARDAHHEAGRVLHEAFEASRKSA